MYCANCRREIDKGWTYCPYCGLEQEKKGLELPFLPGFGNIFKDIEEEFLRLDRLFEGNGSPVSGGVDIKIIREGDREPTIDIQTHGDMKDLEPEIREKLGQEEKRDVHPPPEHVREPETRMWREDDTIVYEMDVPLCKCAEDCEVRRLQESLEIKAYAGDTAYFKLIRIPAGAQVLDWQLEGETLRVRIGV